MRTLTRAARHVKRAAAAACSLALWAGAAHAATVVSVHSFSNVPDGAAPASGLVKGVDGALYGTTMYGGIYGIDPRTNSGNGTLYRVGTENEYAQLYSFTFLDANWGNVDGRWPDRPLLAAPDGMLYGVAPYGGSNDGGTVYRFSPGTAAFSALHDFEASLAAPGGTRPEAPLTLGTDGRLYGSTPYGGTTSQGLGTLFTLPADGSSFGVPSTTRPKAASTTSARSRSRWKGPMATCTAPPATVGPAPARSTACVATA